MHHRNAFVFAVFFCSFLAAGEGGAGATKSEGLSSGVFGFRRDGSGIFRDAKPPTTWNIKNALWKTTLPGAGNSSPVVLGDAVFLTCEPNVLICCDRATGAIRWKAVNSFAEALKDPARDSDLPKPEWNGTYGYATPTPVTDGKHVWAVFGHGIVTCFTVAGQRVWAQGFDAKKQGFWNCHLSNADRWSCGVLWERTEAHEGLGCSDRERALER